MKNTDMLLAMNLLEDKYIEEAAPKKRYVRFRRAIIPLVAIFFTLSVFLFFPYNKRPPSVREYSESEYYDIIQKLNEYSFEEPKYANNFDKLLSEYLISKNRTPNDYMGEGSDESDVSFTDSESFSEDANEEAAEVNEGDIAVFTDDYIFYCDAKEGLITVYSKDGEASIKLKIYTALPGSNYGSPKMYISEDQKTLSIVCHYRNREVIELINSAGMPYENEVPVRYCSIISLDVSDPRNIVQKGRVTLRGSLCESVQTDGKLIVTVSYTPGKSTGFDFSDPSTFIPVISTGDGFSPLPASSIIAPAKLTSARYTVMLMLDENDLSLLDCKAYLSESADIYISSNSIYTTRTLTSEKKEGDYTYISPYTVVTRISYSEGKFKMIGAITLKGQVLSHSFLNEKDGVLRIVTKTSVAARHNKIPIYYCCGCLREPDLIATSANVYLVSIEDMQLQSYSENLCAEDMSLESVLYSGGSAHLSLSSRTEKLSQTLSVDLDTLSVSLSDAKNEKSSMLLDLGGGYYVTVQGKKERVKISETSYSTTYRTDYIGVFVTVYSLQNGILTEVDSYKIEAAKFTDVYNIKDFVYIDRGLGLIGFGIERDMYDDEDPDDYDADDYPVFNEERYVLLQFKDGNLYLKLDTPLSGNYEDKRAVYTDGYLYAVSPDGFTAVPIKIS